MCGIAGSFTLKPTDGDRPALERALGRLRHRGPNGQGIEAFAVNGGRLLLGHRRLAIIDLSDAGLQPMASNDGRYIVTFNGEIYNYLELRGQLQAMGHIFQTQTDTEVLLTAWQQWGQSCLTRLDGMFALAVYDREEQVLTCVRDSFGIKPLFYAKSETGFGFASEVPALIEMGIRLPRLNRSRAHAFLCWGDYDDSDDTFYQDFLQLRPGHLLRVELDDFGRSEPTIERWWWPSIEERTDLSFDDAADGLRELFLQSVRRQLRSDVPLGATLSGGLDSSAIVCAVRHIAPDLPINTFSYDANSSVLSEKKWAQLVIDHVGAIPHWTDDQTGDIGSELDDIIKAQGEPFGSTSIAASYRVLRLASENGITVTLDGQGADELLAGYWGYPASAFRSRLDRHAYGELLRFARAWKGRPGCSWRLAALHLGDALVAQRFRDAAFSIIGHTAEPAWVDVDRLREAGFAPHSAAPLPQQAEGKGRRLAERLRNALTVNRLPTLLRHADRNSMRWSIENRVPFLTPDIAKFTLALPEDYLLSPAAETKHVFRHAMRGIVPDEILNRRDKIGFATPELDVLRRERPRIDSWIEAAREIDFLNFEPLKQEIDRILDGAIPFSFKAWRMINYCRWVSLQPAGIH